MLPPLTSAERIKVAFEKAVRDAALRGACWYTTQMLLWGGGAVVHIGDGKFEFRDQEGIALSSFDVWSKP